MKNFLWSEHEQDFWGTHLDKAKDKHFQEPACLRATHRQEGRAPENAWSES